MKQNHVFLAIFLAAALLICGCATLPGGPGPGPNAGGGAPTTGPTVTMPPEKAVEIQINEKDPIYATITVIFAGGKGQIAVTDILVQVTLADGKVVTGHLKPIKGNELTFQGTKETDRIEIWVSLNDGTTYKTIDQLVPYRTRG